MTEMIYPNLEDVRIFIVEDEDVIAWGLESELKIQKVESMRAESIRHAIERFPKFGADVALIDLHLPDGNGLELLKKWRHEYPDTPMVMMTAHGAVGSVIEALRLGAIDFVLKPFEMKEILAAANRAAELAKLRSKVSQLSGSEKKRETVDIVGTSYAITNLVSRVSKIAASRADTILIHGESGSGKELVARALHEWSERAKQPFVEINCASIPENLLESELFGYEKGAFTDAKERKLGLFEMARNGTIFLDEIGEMPAKLQSKLLRALEYRRFKRLGGTRDIEFTARIVAATNRDLLEEVGKRNFRGDLFYRLNVLPVTIPPLRARKEDIGPLVKHFVKKIAGELGIVEPTIGADVLPKIVSHDWPGNVRELRNVLVRALVFNNGSEVRAADIEIDRQWLCEHASEVAPHADVGQCDVRLRDVRQCDVGHGEDHPFLLPTQGVQLDHLEKDLIQQALDRSRNNQSKAAKLLGITRHTLRYRLEKHGLIDRAAELES